jgi:hypothetical protein
MAYEMMESRYTGVLDMGPHKKKPRAYARGFFV